MLAMNETLMMCITQIITTLLTIGVTALVAYLTYHAQKLKTEDEIKRMRSVNLKSALELFYAYISNLIIFSSEKEIKLDTSDLRFCIDKMKMLEQYLSELTETELPDTFIENFRFYRLKVTFHRISIEQRLANVTSNSVSSLVFNDLDTLELIQSLKDFIFSYENPDDH